MKTINLIGGYYGIKNYDELTSDKRSKELEK